MVKCRFTVYEFIARSHYSSITEIKSFARFSIDVIKTDWIGSLKRTIVWYSLIEREPRI